MRDPMVRAGDYGCFAEISDHRKTLELMGGMKASAQCLVSLNVEATEVEWLPDADALRPIALDAARRKVTRR